MAVSYRRLGTTSLEMRPTDCPETSVRNNYSMLHKNPKEHRPQITISETPGHVHTY